MPVHQKVWIKFSGLMIYFTLLLQRELLCNPFSGYSCIHSSG